MKIGEGVKMITVNVIDDHFDEMLIERNVIQHVTTAGNLVVPNVEVFIEDDDEASIQLSRHQATLQEGFGSLSYSIRLTSMPRDTVHVLIHAPGFNLTNLRDSLIAPPLSNTETEGYPALKSSLYVKNDGTVAFVTAMVSIEPLLWNESQFLSLNRWEMILTWAIYIPLRFSTPA